MRKILLPILCALLPLHAWAINKCEVDGKITYTEQPCTDGHEIVIVPPPSQADVQQAKNLAANQKAVSSNFENDRMNRSNTAMQADKGARLTKEQRTRCQDLERRKNIGKEDGPDVAEKLEEKPAKKMPTAAEQYQTECAGK